MLLCHFPRCCHCLRPLMNCPCTANLSAGVWCKLWSLHSSTESLQPSHSALRQSPSSPRPPELALHESRVIRLWRVRWYFKFNREGERERWYYTHIQILDMSIKVHLPSLPLYQFCHPPFFNPVRFVSVVFHFRIHFIEIIPTSLPFPQFRLSFLFPPFIPPFSF